MYIIESGLCGADIIINMVYMLAFSPYLSNRHMESESRVGSTTGVYYLGSPYLSKLRTATVLSNDPDANFLPSQFQPTE